MCVFREEVEEFFDSMDRDFDGRLSFEEFMGEESPIEKLFKNMDKNGDGLVTKQVCETLSIPSWLLYGNFDSFIVKNVLLESEVPCNFVTKVKLVLNNLFNLKCLSCHAILCGHHIFREPVVKSYSRKNLQIIVPHKS